MSVTGKRGVGVPLILMHDGEGTIVTIECKNGDTSMVVAVTVQLRLRERRARARSLEAGARTPHSRANVDDLAGTAASSTRRKIT